ncbi:FliH/SctL family protein [Spiribacter halobius]|uniref:Flagellar assembly protein FliH n=1 Tax=Sediminicurvatus halobius TaxID=2182432 RepID=A0A2U2MZS5_9GAMM|nr:FliH/SctL family protein [Spiribacter halobius]PWG62293.1 flagellar assembly protein FliH [Spiribacter halobius]UEX79786.1 flagellar assembly protein FliH [Spiribacter halobius]
MNQERVIPRERAAAGDAWELPDMGAGARRQPQRPDVSVEALERIQRDAYQEAFEQGRREGYEAGFREGRDAGLKQGQAEGRQLVQRLRQVLDATAEPAAQLDQAAEDELAALALAAARQVIRREIQTQPGEVVAVVREAVGLLPLSAREITVRLHPDDAAFVRETLGEGERSAWRLQDDPALSRGGCVVETPRSRVDASLERRLNALAADLLGAQARVEDGDEDEPGDGDG